MTHFSLPSASLIRKKSGHSSMKTFGSGCSNSTRSWGPTNHVIGGEQPYLAALFYGGDTEGHVPLVSGLPYLPGHGSGGSTLSSGQSMIMPRLVALVSSSLSGSAIICTCQSPPGVVDAVGPAVAGVVELELAVIADHCGTGEHAVLSFESRANMIGSRFQLSMSLEETCPSASGPHWVPYGAAGRTRANGLVESTGRSDR